MIIVFANKKKQNKSLEEKIEMLSMVKDDLKKNKVSKVICKEHDFDLDIIDGISLEFCDDLDVSAKTVNSKIMLNEALIDEPYEVLMRYVIHELVHALQHMEREGKKDQYSNYEYLDRPDELEAFKFQVMYESENRGQEHAEEYVDELIEYHEIDDKEEKKEELLEKTKDK